MGQLLKVSLDDDTKKGFCFLSQRKVEITVFTKAALLVSEPLTMHCAGIVLLHLPNSLLLLWVSLSSPSKSAALRPSPSSLFQRTRCREDATQQSKMTAAQCYSIQWLHVADGYTVSPPGNTVCVCGIWISKWELTPGAKGGRKSLYCCTVPCVSVLWFIQKVDNVFSYFFTKWCTCLLFYLFFNLYTYSYLFTRSQQPILCCMSY